MEMYSCDNHTDYEFRCPQCGTKYKLLDMPSREVMKQIGHMMTCPKCGTRISIIDFQEE